MKVLPVIDAYAFRYKTMLSGKPFVLRFTWDARATSWHLDIGLTDGTWVANGIRIVVGYPLLYRRQDSRLPRGQLYARASEGGEIAQREDLGTRVKLFYIPAAEIPAKPLPADIKITFPS